MRNDDRLKGVNKITFTKYYDLPGIISDRLYAVFDKNNNGHVDVQEFIEGMKVLFTEGFAKTSKFIFDFYDFNKDGLISKEDIRTVLSYVPLNTKEKVIGQYDGESYKDRVESQEELHELLEKSFKDFHTELIDYTQFLTIIENICSDIYFFIVIFLLEKKPFSRNALIEYEKQRAPKDNSLKISVSGVEQKNFNQTSQSFNKCASPSKLVASPNMKSKFSPSITLSKSPFKCGKSLNLMEECLDPNSKDYLLQYVKRTPEKSKLKTTKESKVLSLDYFERRSEKEKSIKIPVNRKERHNLKNMDEQKKAPVKNEYNDLPITPAIKTLIKKPTISKDKEKEIDIEVNTEKMIIDSTEPELALVSQFSGSNSENSDETSDDEETLRCEGYLWKITDTKRLKKLWFKLLDKDFYYFKSESENVHNGMHNLSGLFVKEEKPAVIEDRDFFCFSVTYPKKVRYYYVEAEDEMKKWVYAIKKATGYADLTDIYEVKEKLGNGKFGLVRLGIHKSTGKKTAIKIMSKKDMNNQDLELLKTEIEILKISQHPHIIRLIDVFENVDFVYVIMEYCSGGDLFSYIETRGFRLAEQQACQIIHKLCTSIYYIHSYGIAHRDLKPENILMTDNTDNADIRLLDFGLSKIIGPTQTCNEPYGTLSYVAPEVLLEQPYTKAVDLWSIGITTYLLLAGCLPFDHESSEREIARQTIHDPVRWGSIWKKLSNEAKSFVESNYY